MKKVWIVWLVYPTEERRMSAIFTSREAADAYANRNPRENKGYKCVVTQEPVFRSAEEV